jgi:purine-binding chemotaxis protein CheW
MADDINDDLRTLYDKRAAQLAARRTGSAPAAEIRRVLVFKVADETFGIEAGDVVEILRYRGSTPVPGTPETLMGLINVRCEIRPLLNIARLLGVSASRNEAGYVLLVRAQDEIFGFKIDEIERVRDLRTSEVSAPDSDQAESRRLKGITTDKLMLIDVFGITQQVVDATTGAT